MPVSLEGYRKKNWYYEGIKFDFFKIEVLWNDWLSFNLKEVTVEIVYNETGYNEQPDITSRFGAKSGLVDALIWL